MKLRRAGIPMICCAIASFAAFALAAGADETPAPTKGGLRESLLSKLLAPGPLVGGHVKYEKADCLICHEGGKGVPDSKCTDCHKEIKKVVASKHGYHGTLTEPCYKCHTDHKGRETDIVKFDEKKFDHKLSGFPLTGKHADIKCVKCHTEKRTGKYIRPGDTRYFGAQAATCVSCHKKQDVHFFTGPWAKKDCNACHGVDKWKMDIRFDHEKDGKWKLAGKHFETKCKECHVPKGRPPIYQWPKLKEEKCLSCHKDIHRENLNKKFRTGACDRCHTERSWRIAEFDHDKTDYELRGAHEKVECLKCHKQSPAALNTGVKAFKWNGLAKTCMPCHTDIHRGKFSPRFADGKCEKCHTVEKWKLPEFDHKITTYPLKGAHAPPLKCEKCHKQSETVLQQPDRKNWMWAGLKQTCLPCHKDLHQFGDHKAKYFKNLNDCLACHNEVKWKEIHFFKHNDHTRYVIDGKHLPPVKCMACHMLKDKDKKPIRPIYKWPELLTKTCENCHPNVHAKTFSPKFLQKKCTECHVTSGWKIILGAKINHNTTRFPLVGKHVKVACDKCHLQNKMRIYRWDDTFEKKFCVSCHKDVHEKQFTEKTRERSCADCHNQENWTQRYKFDHDKTLFPLRNKHSSPPLKCEKCHKPTTFVLQSKPPRPALQFMFPAGIGTNCIACHKDPHKGSFEMACTECHDDRSWKKSPEFHKNFTLTGVHYSLQCKECHTANRQLTGMSDRCNLCHQKDDIHHGTLPDCGECHRQQFWDNPRFRHGLTLFPLTGIHRTLDCTACHAGSIYRGLPYHCVDCHLSNSAAVVSVPHTMPAFQQCERCHNQYHF